MEVSRHLARTRPTLPPRAGALLGKRVLPLSARSAAPLLSPVQVYRLFFGSFPLIPDETHERDLWDGFGPGEKMTQLEVRSSEEDVVGQSSSCVSRPCPTTGQSGGIHPGRGDVMGCCQVARAAPRDGWVLSRCCHQFPQCFHSNACASVSHCNGSWHHLDNGCGGTGGYCSLLWLGCRGPMLTSPVLPLPMETTDMGAVGLFTCAWGDPGEPPHHQPPHHKLVLLQKSLPSSWRSLREGLVHRALRDPAAAPRRPALLRLLSQALGLASASPAPTTSDSPQAFITEMEVSTSWGEPGACGPPLCQRGHRCCAPAPGAASPWLPVP